MVARCAGEGLRQLPEASGGPKGSPEDLLLDLDLSGLRREVLPSLLRLQGRRQGELRELPERLHAAWGGGSVNCRCGLKFYLPGPCVVCTFGGKSVRVVWLRPALESDRTYFGRKLSGRIQSIWGIEVNGRLIPDQFTSKRAALQWARRLKTV